jgi:hypothetical protein
MVAEKNDKNWWKISLILFAIIIVLLLFFFVEGSTNAPAIHLSVLLVIGVIALLVALSFTAVIFKSLDLANPNSTLGLPEGSVQAVIALCLILIFIISSLFLYYEVSFNEVYISRDITQEQINDIPKEEIVSIIRGGTIDNETLYTVTRSVEKSSKTGDDIAKQIITTVSTLVVAVAGFYFGTKSVATARGGLPGISVPVIRSITPTGGKRQENIEFRIFGKNLELAKEIKLIHESIELQCRDITSSSTIVTCKLKIPQNIPAGNWTVVVINSDEGEDRLEDAFSVSEI